MKAAASIQGCAVMSSTGCAVVARLASRATMQIAISRKMAVSAAAPSAAQRLQSSIWRLLVVSLAMAAAAPGGKTRAEEVLALSEMAAASRVGLGPSGALAYYAARTSSGALPDPAAVVSALIVIHGFPHDANRTLGAGALAASRAGRASDTVVLAPLFQVAASAARRCQFPGNPPAQSGDALWTCSSWINGGAAEGGGPSSFAALDALIAHVTQSWPRVRSITLAGFSAGAQFVQRYIGFTRPPAGIGLRFVVADPGTWLYFDAQRPVPLVDGQPADWTRCNDASCEFGWRPLDGAAATACPQANRWKYGTEALPPVLGSSADEARARYAAADASYLEGALDAGDGKGSFFGVLDKSCAAELQGPFRLQRGLAYAAYAKRFLAANHPFAIVPGCAHDVSCVFPSEAARGFLFPE